MHSFIHRHPHAWLAATLAVPLTLAVACGTEAHNTNRSTENASEAGDIDAEPTRAEPDPDALAATAGAFEPWLSCVTAPLERSDSFGRVVVERATFELQSDGTLAATLTRGPQFPHNADDASSDESALLTRTFTLSPARDGGGALGIFEGFGDHDLWLQVTLRAGVFPTVEIFENACYVINKFAMNCFGALALNATRSDDERTRALFPAVFDDERGACVDNRGRVAHNDVPLWFVQETGRGACADLRGANLNGNDVGYPALTGWDLRGADLDGATLHFADLRGASLQGADLSGMEFGYASVTGFIDDNTLLPGEPGSPCTVSDHPSQGRQVSCRR